MANRHRGTDTDRAMRSREISEVLNEDARINQKAWQKNFPFVQQSKEEWLRPDELDRKTAYELAGFLDKMSSSLSQAVSAMAIPAEAGKLTQGISEYLSAYNRATAYVRLYGRTGKLSSREEMAIQEKFDGVKPSLEQIINAHAAGTPIPEFRAVLESYDNISNNDLRPVNFSPPINIPAPPQPQGAQPIAPIVGPLAPRPQGAPAAPAAPAIQPAPAIAPQAPQRPPNIIVPEDVLRAAAPRQAFNWIVNNRDQLPPETRAAINAAPNARAQGQVVIDFLRVQRALQNQYDADLAAFNQQQGVAPPPAQQQQVPIQPQQPAAPPAAALTRADTNLIRELEGNRQNVAAADAALQAAIQAGQGIRGRREALDVAQRKFRRAEERAIRAGVANIPYDPNTMGAPMPPRVGDGRYGGVSAEMASMDDEYMDMELHPKFADRGNWSGMMKALQGMPTAPFGAGIEIEEGEEMPIGTFGSAKRIGFVPDPDYISSEEEPEEEMEDDDMYDREMATRQQLDDSAEKIQSNRLQKELKVAKGSGKNMREMLDKLRSKIKCR